MTDIVDDLRNMPLTNKIAQRAADEIETLQARVDRYRQAEPLIKWIDGMCVDEAPHMDIREGINRYWGRVTELTALADPKIVAAIDQALNAPVEQLHRRERPS